MEKMLKGKFLDDLQNNAFSETNGEDAVEHIETFLKIVDPLVLPNVRMTETKAKWDPTDVVFENWLASRFTNHRTMDLFTKNALWDYWKIGDDEIALTNGKVFDLEEEYSNDDGEIDEIFRIETRDEHIDPNPGTEPEPYRFRTKTVPNPGIRWKDDGYCNGGNLPGTFRVGNTLHYQDLEWYEALDDSKLKGEALKNKAIMEGLIDEDGGLYDKAWKI
ncbi:hypothetical protein Tco_0425083 [Tanacetum coccineum]